MTKNLIIKDSTFFFSPRKVSFGYMEYFTITSLLVSACFKHLIIFYFIGFSFYQFLMKCLKCALLYSSDLKSAKPGRDMCQTPVGYILICFLIFNKSKIQNQKKSWHGLCLKYFLRTYCKETPPVHLKKKTV